MSGRPPQEGEFFGLGRGCHEELGRAQTKDDGLFHRVLHVLFLVDESRGPNDYNPFSEVENVVPLEKVGLDGRCPGRLFNSQC